jgi:choline kinase
MSIIKHAIISAAGMGTRIGLNIPKCLLKFDGVSIIEHQLNLLNEIEDIRVVVGFMEESVIKEARKFRNDITFVRNPNYQQTSNTTSIYLAMRELKAPSILIDGDLLINKENFKKFISKYDGNNPLVGITNATTDNAVYVEINNKSEAIKFDTNTKSKYEWSGIACINNIEVKNDVPFLYQVLSKHLPLKTEYIECSEIDTPDDLNRAQNLKSRYFG